MSRDAVSVPLAGRESDRPRDEQSNVDQKRTQKGTKKQNAKNKSSKAPANRAVASEPKNPKIAITASNNDDEDKLKPRTVNHKADGNKNDVNRDNSGLPPNDSGNKSTVIVVGFCCIVFTTIAFLLLLYFFMVDVIMTVAPGSSSSARSNTSSSSTFSTVPTVDTVYCNTEYCNREASYIRGLLSNSKGPCDNFYDHVCGRWTSQHPVKGSGAGDVVSVDTMIQDELSKLVLPLLMESQNVDVRVAASLYSACTDDKKKNAALHQMQELYKLWKIGQWPRHEHANALDVWTFAGQLVRDMGLDALVRVSVAPSSRAPLNTTAELNKPRFIFSCNDASRQSVTRLFRMALTDVASEISQSDHTSLVDEVMTAFVRLGSAPLLPAVADTDLSTSYVAKLTNLDPGYRVFLTAAFHRARFFDDVDTEVVVRSSDYVRHFLPTAVRELRPRAMLNYLGFLVLVQVAPFLPDKLRSLRQLFAKNARGRTVDDAGDTASLCLTAVERVLPACFGRILAERFKVLFIILTFLNNVFAGQMTVDAAISLST
ncbi:hypothetical protein HPB49_005226 [Dermacentor silvarum]|uniref:Uncharacterized protein n=1 Tax=Dermacentor silvarum TaxID=543639 RepID=A0ACB8CQ27_DERSI|nr:hypothetical protein HPB49_005226 [Dermacentor silvarum]